MAALERWIKENPRAVPVLGLVVGLSQEKLKNALKQHVGTNGWITAARERPGEVIAMLDAEFGLVNPNTARDLDASFEMRIRGGTRSCCAWNMARGGPNQHGARMSTV